MTLGLASIDTTVESDLRSLGVSDLLGVNPILRLDVFGVVNLLGRVNCGFEFFEQGAGTLALSVEENFEGVVGAGKSC